MAVVEGKVAVVTGARRGVGRVIAFELSCAPTPPWGVRLRQIRGALEGCPAPYAVNVVRHRANSRLQAPDEAREYTKTAFNAPTVKSTSAEFRPGAPDP